MGQGPSGVDPATGHLPRPEAKREARLMTTLAMITGSIIQVYAFDYIYIYIYIYIYTHTCIQ